MLIACVVFLCVVSFRCVYCSFDGRVVCLCVGGCACLIGCGFVYLVLLCLVAVVYVLCCVSSCWFCSVQCGVGCLLDVMLIAVFRECSYLCVLFV